MAPQEGRDGGKSWLSLGAELHAEGQVRLATALWGERAEVSICETDPVRAAPRPGRGAGGGRVWVLQSRTWVWVQALSPASCVTLMTFLGLSEPWFSQRENRSHPPSTRVPCLCPIPPPEQRWHVLALIGC